MLAGDWEGGGGGSGELVLGGVSGRGECDIGRGEDRCGADDVLGC